jgi:hypothetical protein
MGSMYFKPLTPEDRQRHEYLDKINHAPYFTIFMTIAVMFALFTLAVLLGIV